MTISWDLLYVDFFIFGIWLTTIIAMSPRVNKFTNQHLQQFFHKIEEYDDKVDEEVFKEWDSEYSEITNLKASLRNVYYYGIALMMLLLISAFTANVDIFPLDVFLNIFEFGSGLIFFISFASLIGWYYKEMK